MVLSLACSSLLSIAAGIKDGTILHPYLLPPKLRQRILDTVLQRDLINEPNCMPILSSVQFLNGMESFSTEAGNYELEFLDLLETSMATMLLNGETVGAGITKLNLSVYSCVVSRGLKTSSYPMVVRLIAQCPNTTSLALCGIDSILALAGQDCGISSRRYPSVLNKNNVCDSVMGNLVDLSLRDMEKVLSIDSPMINFNQLSTLKLDNCSLQFDIWPQFLSNIPTLQNLHMIGVKGVGKGDYPYYSPNHENAYGLDWILPFPMPHLQLLEVVSTQYQFIFECNRAFVDNLLGCKQLRRVRLTLDQNSTDEESLERLAAMNIDLRVKARFSEYDLTRELRKYKINAALDSSSKFKIVRIFNERIDSFELLIGRKWMPEYTTALEDAIDLCSNLTVFSLLIPDKSHLTDGTEIEPADMNRINATLLQIFGNWDRAMQLKELTLLGKFDESIIFAVFDCCFNLDRLDISSCLAIRDQHLIDWASNGGGKLKHLNVVSCRNVTSEGILPILVNSGEGLLRINAYSNQGNGDGRNWKTVLNSLCPYAKIW